MADQTWTVYDANSKVIATDIPDAVFRTQYTAVPPAMALPDPINCPIGDKQYFKRDYDNSSIKANIKMVNHVHLQHPDYTNLPEDDA